MADNGNGNTDLRQCTDGFMVVQNLCDGFEIHLVSGTTSEMLRDLEVTILALFTRKHLQGLKVVAATGALPNEWGSIGDFCDCGTARCMMKSSPP